MLKFLGGTVAVITVIAIFVIGIPITMLGGVVLSDLWRWFIVPIFHLPTFNFMQAVGIAYVAGFFKVGLATRQAFDLGDAPILSAFSSMIGTALGYLLLWGLGAIWAHFI